MLGTNGLSVEGMADICEKDKHSVSIEDILQ